MHYMTGEWKVDICYGPDIWLAYKLPSDEILYDYRNNSIIDTTYSIYDSTICSLPQIEYMQDWTITNKENELFIKISSLWGDTNKIILS